MDRDEGGRMEIEIYLPMQSISPAHRAGLIDLSQCCGKKDNSKW